MDILAKRFNAKCEPRKPWFYRVLVFKKTEMLHAYLRHYATLTGHDPKRYKNTAGCCAWTGPLPYSKHCIGWISMSIEFNKHVTIASHELCHAAIFYWTNTLRLKMASLDGDGNASAKEERFCRISQELARTFWMGWQRKPRKRK